MAKAETTYERKTRSGAPTIKYLLLQQLQAAVIRSSQVLEISEIEADLFKFQVIPLHQVKDEMQLTYVSAIAFKLASSWQKTITDIANQIGTNIDPSGGINHAALADFTVKVVPPGWIYMQLSDLGTAAWLQRLARSPFWEVEDFKGTSALYRSASLFSVQYAHARCCGLLRLADREQMVIFKESDPFPWLDPLKQLRLVHPAERSLIFHQVALADALYYPSLNDWEKYAKNLSRSFEIFYSQCRLWSEVKTEAPELVRARLGLIVITRSLLRLVLEDLLGVPAPLEL